MYNYYQSHGWWIDRHRGRSDPDLTGQPSSELGSAHRELTSNRFTNRRPPTGRNNSPCRRPVESGAGRGICSFHPRGAMTHRHSIIPLHVMGQNRSGPPCSLTFLGLPRCAMTHRFKTEDLPSNDTIGNVSNCSGAQQSTSHHSAMLLAGGTGDAIHLREREPLDLPSRNSPLPSAKYPCLDRHCDRFYSSQVVEDLFPYPFALTAMVQPTTALCAFLLTKIVPVINGTDGN